MAQSQFFKKLQSCLFLSVKKKIKKKTYLFLTSSILYSYNFINNLIYEYVTNIKLYN